MRYFGWKRFWRRRLVCIDIRLDYSLELGLDL
jgi:hypothetical protein